MPGVKSWTVTLVFYFLILVVLIANLDGSSSLYGILPRRAIAAPKRASRKLEYLGITGRKLLDFYSLNLLELSESAEDSSPRISLYYDSFYKYLYGPEKAPETLECNPARSVVAKLTADVLPLPLHSHNDYWRDLPLFEGIAHGAVSTEADVWLAPAPRTPGEAGSPDDMILAVGHNELFLDPIHRTLDQLYTGPLKTMLDQVSCREGHKGGVFYDSPEKTLFFYVDFKSRDNILTYKLLMDRYSKPLADAGYLTYYDLESRELVWNQVTLILTGDFPRDLKVIDNNQESGYYGTGKRHAFQEADILDLSGLEPNASVVSTSSFDRLLEKCGSSDKTLLSQGSMDSSTVKCVKSYIDKSHEAGLKTRIWGGPSWPLGLATTVWKQQIDELGIDLLNVDNLDSSMYF